MSSDNSKKKTIATKKMTDTNNGYINNKTKEEDICSICKTSKEESRVLEVLDCGHSFHTKCMEDLRDELFLNLCVDDQHEECPLCHNTRHRDCSEEFKIHEYLCGPGDIGKADAYFPNFVVGGKLYSFLCLAPTRRPYGLKKSKDQDTITTHITERDPSLMKTPSLS